jgi:hypothetical protein
MRNADRERWAVGERGQVSNIKEYDSAIHENA